MGLFSKSMFKEHKEEVKWGGRLLTLETGKIARQADGAVLATYGETVVLATVVAARKSVEGQDFFPLTVHYQEKMYAAGKIPGGYLKRESKPSDREVLVSRLIDRPIRPLFPDTFLNEVQVIATVLSYDSDHESDVVAMVAASAALAISGVPFLGPIGAARVAYVNGQYVINPTPAQMAETSLDLVVAGTKEGVLMVESEARELSEDVVLGAVTAGSDAFQDVIKTIEKLAKKVGNKTWDVPELPAAYGVVKKDLTKLCEKELIQAYSIKEKQDRADAIGAVKAKAKESLGGDEDKLSVFDKVFKAMESDILRGDVLKSGKRVDGRDTKTVRPIAIEVGLLPKVHGSALFTRGETQALVVATLGTGQDEQRIDGLQGDIKESFMLHYNFPPFSVGECGRLGAPGRREVGHGKLAWRAIHPMLPSAEEFPYTLRLVSEITESNGSSSMATVCGTSLALMDAGVPLKAPVAGVAMGLVKEGKDFVVLTDIMGLEDHLGDMDFKVAGTDKGVTSLQMDIKITSITKEIMDIALKQAHEARLHILKEMTKAIKEPRQDLSKNAPRITMLKIPKDKIGELIGPGGSRIREICEVSGAKIDIEDDGTVKVAAVDGLSADKALSMIKGITAEPEVGEIYEGKVVKVMDFGAFVNFMGPRDGLVHVSEMADKRVEHPSDVVKEGDRVKVKLVGVDDRGKFKLSMKQAK